MEDSPMGYNGPRKPLVDSLDKALGLVSDSINKRQWPKAAQQAADTTYHWPRSLQAWKQRYLVALLLNNMVAAAEYASHLRTLPGFSEVDLGDMLRDQVLGIVRNREASQYDNALNLVVQVQRLHNRNKNRELCIMGAHGRLMEAMGDHERALLLMLSADRGWAAIGEKANKQWRYNNWVHLQRQLVHPQLAYPAQERYKRIGQWVMACYYGVRLAVGLPGAKWTPGHAATGLTTPFPPLAKFAAKLAKL